VKVERLDVIVNVARDALQILIETVGYLEGVHGNNGALRVRNRLE